MPRLHRLMVVGSTVTTALIALALPASAATASTGPRIAPAGQVASPTLGGSSDNFNSDSCTSGAFCMAIGAYRSGGRTPALSEMFSGGSWVAEPVPAPSPGSNVFANEISCASPANCLFVGEHWGRRPTASANLAEAWNGSSWRIITATGPARSTFSFLDDVACPTTKFCLVTGAAGSSRNYQDAAYTWENGTTWRRIAVPSPSRARNSQLGGLACVNSKNCMAVGNYTSASGHFLPFAARWHDGRWQLQTTPAVPRQRLTVFQGISCAMATRCVAVGITEDETPSMIPHAFAEVWTGGKWHLSTLRRSDSAFLGASCPTRNRCFASGYTIPSTATFGLPLIEAWNGRAWTTQHPVETSAPNSGDDLQHVSCVSQYDCEAVGYSYDPSNTNIQQTLAEHWNGHYWALQSTPNP